MSSRYSQISKMLKTVFIIQKVKFQWKLLNIFEFQQKYRYVSWIFRTFRISERKTNVSNATHLLWYEKWWSINRYVTAKNHCLKLNSSIWCIDRNKLKLKLRRDFAYLNLNTADFWLTEKCLFKNNTHANSRPMISFNINNNNSNQCLKLNLSKCIDCNGLKWKFKR